MELKQRRTILDLKSQEARDFLMRSGSYCTFELPQYFDFQLILDDARDILQQNKNKINNCCKVKAGDQTEEKQTEDRVCYGHYPEVNYNLICNKRDLYDWRGYILRFFALSYEFFFPQIVYIPLHIHKILQGFQIAYQSQSDFPSFPRKDLIFELR